MEPHMPQRPQRDEAALRAFVEDMARLLGDWGFPRMAGRVVFTLMASDERSLSAGELADRLGVSAAAISGAVRYLSQIAMVTREHVPGSRRDRYRLVDDSWYEVTVAKMTLLKTLADAAGEGAAAAGGPATPAGARLAGMRDFYNWVQERMPTLLDQWAEHKAAKAGQDPPAPTPPAVADPAVRPW
ncbi:MarR family transcriptional regulator [Dactylosporangium aurantiacum]|uniref:MarR family transcriptional regulator n=2 Tax=Dactylosporangium aurantiacum TaxID=35754 RepID=A0A9Q9ILN9_9ACTN|nr:MarR family transcriptional regulator [Dactylosporangium aurantiacum]UWZ57951.1 MarR family transcriptional regulator [Dactylosporangium aurantiacum]